MKVQIFKVYWCKCGNDEFPHKWHKIRNPKLHGKAEFKTYVYDIDGKYCCDEMKEALDGDFITFGNPDYTTITENTSLNITKESWGTDIIPIKFCPFCGEPIEYEECGDYEEK